MCCQHCSTHIQLYSIQQCGVSVCVRQQPASQWWARCLASFATAPPCPYWSATRPPFPQQAATYGGHNPTGGVCRHGRDGSMQQHAAACSSVSSAGSQVVQQGHHEIESPRRPRVCATPGPSPWQAVENTHDAAGPEFMARRSDR
jgi:hypothetical protein